MNEYTSYYLLQCPYIDGWNYVLFCIIDWNTNPKILGRSIEKKLLIKNNKYKLLIKNNKLLIKKH